jgi:hypothetical protein
MRMKKIQWPSLDDLRDRVRGLTVKDLMQHREQILFAGMLLVILYTVYLLAAEPEMRRLSSAETARQQLQEEFDTLSSSGADLDSETVQVELGQLENEVRSEEAAWEEIRQKGIQDGMSKGVFLREITLVPYSFGWKILAMEQVSDQESELDPFLGTTYFKVKGEGTFSGLFRYLKQIEHPTIPAVVAEMDIHRAEENRETLQGSIVLRVMGLQEDEPAEPGEGEGT